MALLNELEPVVVRFDEIRSSKPGFSPAQMPAGAQSRCPSTRLMVEQEPGGNWRIVRHGVRRKVMCAYIDMEAGLRFARSYLRNRAYDASVRKEVPSGA